MPFRVLNFSAPYPPISRNLGDGKLCGSSASSRLEQSSSAIQRPGGPQRLGRFKLGDFDHVEFKEPRPPDEFKALMHTHPSGDTFSALDLTVARESGLDSYIVKPKGSGGGILVFEPRVGGKLGTITEVLHP